MTELGQQVRRLREEKGWTQVQLAVHAGASPTVVNELERGKRRPSLSTLEKLAEALGVEVSELFVGKADALPSQPSLDNAIAAEAGRSSRELIEIARNAVHEQMRLDAQAMTRARERGEGEPETGSQAAYNEALRLLVNERSDALAEALLDVMRGWEYCEENLAAAEARLEELAQQEERA